MRTIFTSVLSGTALPLTTRGLFFILDTTITMYRTPWMCMEFTTLQQPCIPLRAGENSKVIYSKKLVCLDRILGFMRVLRRPGEAPCRPPSSSICQYWMLMWTGEAMTILNMEHMSVPHNQCLFCSNQLKQPQFDHSSCGKTALSRKCVYGLTSVSQLSFLFSVSRCKSVPLLNMLRMRLVPNRNTKDDWT